MLVRVQVPPSAPYLFCKVSKSTTIKLTLAVLVSIIRPLILPSKGVDLSIISYLYAKGRITLVQMRSIWPA